ncbi:MAG: 4Fe-4S binding protein [Bacteroidales bacterium]|nr:4Fe-4S binding protein [Bacteroidales bacterium]MCF8402856.1 4Fe-4S binding protein [Bacteroidales bacterium]
MSDIYKQLAIELDKIPNGFPATKSGVELKILAKLFSPEQAQLAASMSLEPLSISEVAHRNGIPDWETKAMLIGMVKKGLIDLKKDESKGLVFSLIPFVVGFYERQNAKIDKEFAELFEQYYHEGFNQSMTAEPSVHRIIPIEKTIPVNIDVMPYEKASSYLNEANSWGVLNCICRVQKKLIGKGCDHPIENCIVFSAKPGAFDRTSDIRALSKEEALEILAEAGRAGLVHSTNNAQHDVTYICNCCTCSCGVLRGIVDYGKQNSVASSDFFVRVDADLCNGCEACIDRCQFDALKMDDGISTVDADACYGCGLCVTSCAVEALSLIQKKESHRQVPPMDDDAWRIAREENRNKMNA